MKKTCIAVVALLLASAGAAHADALMDAVGAAKQRSQFYSDSDLPASVISGAAQAAAARDTMNVVNSPEFQERVQKERGRLQQEVFGAPAGMQKNYYADANGSGQGAAPHLQPDERVYLFVSSSMPEATLRAYVRDIGALRDKNISIVMRGFIGGVQNGLPTVKFMTDLLKQDPQCTGSNCALNEANFEIDPNLYRRFKPERVPALVYVKGVHSVDPDASEGIDGNVPPSSSFWMIYGDASFGYLLSRVADDAQSPSLEAMANIIKK